MSGAIHVRAVRTIKHILRAHHHRVRHALKRHHPHVVRAFKTHRIVLSRVRKGVLHTAAATAVAGFLSVTPLNPSAPHKIEPARNNSPNELHVEAESNESLTGKLEHALSVAPNGTLTPEEEKIVIESLSKRFSIDVRGEIEGKRLNRVSGKIGGEQHLKRYPGDPISTHASPEDERPALAGLAPGLGAYGYFADSAQMSEEDVLRERYYIAAQTFLAPGWDQNPNALYEFFRYRKMIIVNAHTGAGVVAVIGDAGPAEWTGKSFGGSPEVMHHVGYSTGPRKGDVFVFFVHDPENKVPLGPLTVTR